MLYNDGDSQSCTRLYYYVASRLIQNLERHRVSRENVPLFVNISRTELFEAIKSVCEISDNNSDDLALATSESAGQSSLGF
jgi:hypothetical protein